MEWNHTFFSSQIELKKSKKLKSSGARKKDKTAFSLFYFFKNTIKMALFVGRIAREMTNVCNSFLLYGINTHLFYSVILKTLLQSMARLLVLM